MSNINRANRAKYSIRKLPDISGRTFTVGDLHGEYDRLMRQLEDIGFDFQSDRLIALGDLIDRGDKSMECLNLLYEPWFHSVRGNHEQMMVDGLMRNHPESYKCWVDNGGTWAIGIVDDDDFNAMLYDIEDQMPIAIEANGCGFIHARPPSDWLLYDERDYMRYMWDRALYGFPLKVANIRQVYVGHTPVRNPPEVIGNIVYIDSGSVFRDVPLCIVEVPNDGTSVTVDSVDVSLGNVKTSSD